MTTPIKPGTRYAIPAPAKEADELKQLDDLIDFLGKVKDTARLRAKEENGVKFLHTRTGTPLGKFWKWLTVGWPNAVEQRKLFRASVGKILSGIKENKSEKIGSLKEKILNQTLAVKVLKEFNLQELQNDLRVLREVVKAEKKALSVSMPASNQAPQSNSPVLNVIAKQRADAIESGSDSSSPKELVFIRTTESIAKHRDGVATEVDPEATPYPVGQASIEEAVVQNYRADTPVEPRQLAPQPQPKRLKPASPGEQHSSVIAEGKPTPAQIGVVESDSSSATGSARNFGCKPIVGSLTASVGEPGNYLADCYIFPADTPNDLTFKLGTLKFSATAKEQQGISLSSEEHIFHNEQRSVTALRLEGVRNKDAGLAKTLDQADREKYLGQLRHRYETALQTAFDKGAKTFVIQPLGSMPLIRSEIDVLRNAINEFQKQHPEVKIQVVFKGRKAVSMFNSAGQVS